MADKFDCVIVGSGPGGYAASIRCAQRGASVALVEKGLIGGTCLNYGCVPSKALLASAQTLLATRRAATMGVDIDSATANWPRIQARKDAIVTGFRKGLTGLIEGNRIKIVEGCAAVIAPNKVKVKTSTASVEMEADSIILATGSEPIELAAIPFDGENIISSKEALELQQIPESLLIVGGGVIGCEFACLFAAMNTRVTIVEALSQLLPMEDQWVGRLLEREFKKQGIEVLTGRKVLSVDKTNGSARVAFENGREVEAEKVLVCIGRRAVCDEETISALGLKTSGGAIAVNEKLETNVPGVYAIGDVVGTTYLAHGAFAEAHVAALNATGGNAEIVDYSQVPRAVYTFPEIASVGKSEEKCKSEGTDVTVGRSFFRANARCVAHEEPVGEVRVIRDNSTNEIVGITMVGAMVTELAGAARTLIGSTETVAEISFPHPTVSEVLKEAAEDAFGLSLHNMPKV
ncbi:MAG: dihydrolipoyl dehydrogenase [Planctomycetota bacterium]